LRARGNERMRCRLLSAAGIAAVSGRSFAAAIVRPADLSGHAS
jgi:hypothetical protein